MFILDINSKILTRKQHFVNKQNVDKKQKNVKKIYPKFTTPIN